MKKKIVISLCMVMAVTAVLTSCKKDNTTVSFRATISNYRNTANNGKVYIDDNRYANWIDQDKVLINGANYTVGVTVTGDNRIASINGVAAVEEGGYYAFYPAERALTTPTDGFPQILLPQVQVYREDGNGNQIVDAPMAAYCSADRAEASLDFTNLCALLKVELGEVMEVGYITVSSSNKPLWGRASISGTDEPVLSSPEIASLYSTDKTVTLDCTTPGLHHEESGASEGVQSAGPFYIVLPPATNVADLTVTIYVFSGNNSSQTRRTITKYTKSAASSSSITIESNRIYGIGDGIDDFVEEEDAPDVPFPNLGSGEFTVSRTRTGGGLFNPTYRYKKVRFSLANLQYNTVDGIWRFAPNQWTSLKGNQGNQNWIDLFGYGTSGVNYSPTLTTTSNSDYASGDIQNTENDWGVNAISNGGNQPNKWRTLTRDEWSHLFNDRSHAQDLHHTRCTVQNVVGMIVLPDDFPYSGYNNDYYWDWSNLTEAQWQEVEAQGAIFIPNSGQRNGTTVNNTTSGYYWSSAQGRFTSDYRLYFNSNGDNYDNPNQYMGSAVRLVRDVN